MALPDEARRRYARHLLLAEVGEAGQASLAAREVAVRGDARAAEVAAMYLSRAGVRVGPSAAHVLDVGSSGRVAALAARPGLGEAAAFLAGAFAAVEEIKRTIGAGAPGTLPRSLVEEGS